MCRVLMDISPGLIVSGKPRSHPFARSEWFLTRSRQVPDNQADQWQEEYRQSPKQFFNTLCRTLQNHHNCIYIRNKDYETANSSELHSFPRFLIVQNTAVTLNLSIESLLNALQGPEVRVLPMFPWLQTTGCFHGKNTTWIYLPTATGYYGKQSFNHSLRSANATDDQGPEMNSAPGSSSFIAGEYEFHHRYPACRPAAPLHAPGSRSIPALSMSAISFSTCSRYGRCRGQHASIPDA